MDDLEMLIQKRIDSPTADLVDQLLEQYLPSLQPCAVPLDAALEQLKARYPLRPLPHSSIQYARTALSVIEAYYPEEASYLQHDWDMRLEGAQALVEPLHLKLFCAEVADNGAGHALYERQRAQYERRTAGTGNPWHMMPIYICAESSSGYCLVTGSDALHEQVICLRGITQEDIDNRTPTLIAYLRAKYGDCTSE